MSELQSKILKLLEDGQFHSGESLGERLGVSRTAVWKQLQKLEAIGLQLESVKGTGYRVPAGFELLDQQQIRDQIKVPAQLMPARLEIFQNIDSTNKYLRDRADNPQYARSLVLAESQSGGRGRRGKTWVSPFAANIYLSALWDFERGAEALEGLSLAVGVAVRRALLEVGLSDVQLKWPNDIYIGRKKLGGILLEMLGDPAGYCSVVVGIGINVSMPSQAAAAIDQDWTDINSQLAQPISRNRLAAALISHILCLLDSFQASGFGPYRDEWQSADAFAGQLATVTTVRDAISGTVVGVDSGGALEMKLASGEIQRFIGGELSLRLAK
ncbi:MAG: bifunctional biotin--[acetyl-CoA-carboxylase] ligase/biotin operon repressor BirA [Porticoccaceae bacterium]|nr:bifunctional biotin--[acetyl-CoA-carboxylase] ligase/biotin operon repressor BirA [Porticoccaceae bacterium]